MTQKFKVGDRVVRIGGSSRTLVKGETYVVSEVHPTNLDIRVKGVDGWWFTRNFQKAETPAQPGPNARRIAKIDRDIASVEKRLGELQAQRKQLSDLDDAIAKVRDQFAALPKALQFELAAEAGVLVG